MRAKNALRQLVILTIMSDLFTIFKLHHTIVHKQSEALMQRVDDYNAAV